MEPIGGACLEDGNVCFQRDALLGGDISLLQLLETAGRRLPLAERGQLVGLLDKGLVFKVRISLVTEFDIIRNALLRKEREEAIRWDDVMRKYMRKHLIGRGDTQK